MAKRTHPKRTSPDDVGLKLKEGERVEFPVSRGHRYARFQTMRSVRSTDEIREFIIMWENVARARECPPADAKLLAAQLKKAKASVLRLTAANLDIPRGAVVVLNNPLNLLQSKTISIAGDLVCRGETVLDCTTLTLS